MSSRPTNQHVVDKRDRRYQPNGEQKHPQRTTLMTVKMFAQEQRNPGSKHSPCCGNPSEFDQ